MIEKFLEGFVALYEAGGIVPVLVLALLLCVSFLIFILYWNTKRYAEEAKISRNESKIIHTQLHSKLESMLEDSERKVEAYELLLSQKERTIESLNEKVNGLEKNEIWLRNEISNLKDRIKILEGIRA